MATGRQKRPETGVVGRLTGRGEDAITRLMDELSKNTVVTDALARAMSAKKGLDAASRTALSQVGLAAADDISELRRQVADLEKRLAKLERAGKAEPARGRRTTAGTAGRKRTQAARTPATGAAAAPTTPRAARTPGTSAAPGAAGGTAAGTPPEAAPTPPAAGPATPGTQRGRTGAGSAASPRRSTPSG